MILTVCLCARDGETERHLLDFMWQLAPYLHTSVAKFWLSLPSFLLLQVAS